MGLNVYTSVPVPAGDGVGAAVSVVGQGLKTFVVGGIFDATVVIEGGIGPTSGSSRIPFPDWPSRCDSQPRKPGTTRSSAPSFVA